MIESFLSQLPNFEWNNFWVSQILVGISFLWALLSFQFKNRRYILYCFILCLIFIAIHYVLLREMVPATLVTWGVIRYGVAIFSTHRNWIYFFSIVALIIFYFTYDSWLSFLFLTGNLLMITSGFQKKDKSLREFQAVGGILYLIYNLLIFSPAMVVLEAFFLISNAVGYWRFYSRKKA